MKKTKIKILIFFAIYFLNVQKVFAAPEITNVSGTFTNGSSVTISGSGFGSNGPNVVLFDDFERGNVGENLGLNATVGSWSGIGTYVPQVSSFGRSGIRAMSTNKGAPNYGKFTKVFSGSQEVFISYAISIPNGTNFPGASTPNDTSTSTGGWFKTAWFGNNIGTSNPAVPNANFSCSGSIPPYNAQSNIVPFSWDGHGWIVGTNCDETNFSGSNNIYNNTWWTFNGWNRMTAWFKAGANPTVDIGLVYLQVLSDSGSRYDYSGPTKNSLGDPCPLFGPSSQLNSDSAEYDQLNIPGAPYYRVDVTDPTYDDIYLATGPNAQARVEIGNSSTYFASTNLAILTPTNWNANAIQVTVRSGNFTSGQQAYLYVIDKDGNVNASGYPITISTNTQTTYSIPDFVALVSNWLHSGSASDLNNDNIINAKDMGMMMSKWN